MTNTGWTEFVVQHPKGRAPDAIAGLCTFFYFERSIREIAADVAAAIDLYVTYIGMDKLTHYTARSGFWKPMTARQLAKDLKNLRNFPHDHFGAHIGYDSEPVPGPYGVTLLSTVLADSFEVQRNNLLRFDYPPDWVGMECAAGVLELTQRLLELMKPQTCNAGLAFKRTEGTLDAANRGVNRLLPRYLGFDPCNSNARNSLRDRILSAHWLNYIDAPLVSACGGLAQLRAQLAGCEVKELAGGLLIQSAKLPPIGDINAGAPDIGCMPDVARALKPIRKDRAPLGDADFDGDSWLARLDELPARPWDNSKV